MSKQKRSKGNKQKEKRRTVHIPYIGTITLAPSRESTKEFCAYYGPEGETCDVTEKLATVWILPGTPPIKYMACPLHLADVERTVQRFLADLQALSLDL